VIFRSREFDGRLVMTSLAPPDYAFADARHRVLVDEDLGFYEPVVDRLAWADGDLVLYVQWCDQERRRHNDKCGRGRGPRDHVETQLSPLSNKACGPMAPAPGFSGGRESCRPQA
jgi:hypothetical protein